MVYMFLAEGFEEVEALAPLDLLRRAKVDIITVGVGGRDICGAHGIWVKADMADSDLDVWQIKPDMVILPGGMPGTLNLDNSKTVHKAIDRALECDGYLAAICAAPSVLGKRGLLKGKNAICYPGFEDKLEGAIISDKRVVTDQKIVTAAGMGVAVEFGLELVELLCGKELADNIRYAVIAD